MEFNEQKYKLFKSGNNVDLWLWRKYPCLVTTMQKINAEEKILRAEVLEEYQAREVQIMKNVDLWLDMVEKIPRVQQGKSQLSVNPTFWGLTPTKSQLSVIGVDTDWAEPPL